MWIQLGTGSLPWLHCCRIFQRRSSCTESTTKILSLCHGCLPGMAGM